MNSYDGEYLSQEAFFHSCAGGALKVEELGVRSLEERVEGQYEICLYGFVHKQL